MCVSAKSLTVFMHTWGKCSFLQSLISVRRPDISLISSCSYVSKCLLVNPFILHKEHFCVRTYWSKTNTLSQKPVITSKTAICPPAMARGTATWWGLVQKPSHSPGVVRLSPRRLVMCVSRCWTFPWMCRNLELGPERGNTVKGIQMQVRVRFFPKCINNLFWQPSLMAMPRQYMKMENSETLLESFLQIGGIVFWTLESYQACPVFGVRWRWRMGWAGSWRRGHWWRKGSGTEPCLNCLNSAHCLRPTSTETKGR